MNQNHPNSIYYTPVGGTGEIGKNCTILEYEDSAVMVDCGLSFPDYHQFGVDIVVPDFEYPLRLGRKLKAIFITHGHEDHIGSLPYFLEDADYKPPVYATELTKAMLESKLQEWELLQQTELNEMIPGDQVRAGDFKVDAYRVTHSIPHAVSYSFETPAGTLFFTGDFKLDSNPIDGHFTEMERIDELGDEGILASTMDVTNSDKPGSTPSESTVGPALEEVFEDHDGRIFTTTFASNVHRVQQIVNVSVKYGRKVIITGRSMIKNFNIARDLGLVEYPLDRIYTLRDLPNLDPGEVSIVCTGSQGEPLAAMTRLAYGEHPGMEIQNGDLVVFSASPIPGNETAIHKVVDRLYKQGADVIFGDEYDVHVSGHASQEDIRAYTNLIDPKFLIPQHGDYRHQMRFLKMAKQMGWHDDEVAIVKNGERWRISNQRMSKDGEVPVGAYYIQNRTQSEIGARLVEEREELAEDGVLTCSIVLDASSGDIVSDVDIASRGFFTESSHPELFQKIERVAENAVYERDDRSPSNRNHLRNVVQQNLEEAIDDQLGVTPTVLVNLNFVEAAEPVRG